VVAGRWRPCGAVITPTVWHVSVWLPLWLTIGRWLSTPRVPVHYENRCPLNPRVRRAGLRWAGQCSESVRLMHEAVGFGFWNTVAVLPLTDSAFAWRPLPLVYVLFSRAKRVYARIDQPSGLFKLLALCCDIVVCIWYVLNLYDIDYDIVWMK
jgi:hypothetical protein